MPPMKPYLPFPGPLLAGLLLLTLLTLPTQVQAGITACHCFRQRSYDPQAPFAADDYILTTCFNSLLATHFGISKRKLITYKMKNGIREQDLLIALALHRENGVEIEKLLAARHKAGSWKKALAILPASPNPPPNSTTTRLATMAPAAVARMVTDEALAAFFARPLSRITALRRAQFNAKEITLLLFLEKTKGIPIANLIEQIKTEHHSWSEIAFYLGITPKTAGRLLPTLKQQPAS